MSIRDFLIKTLGTFFYAGYLPLIPGTFASAVGLGLYYFIKDNPATYLILTSFLIILGFIISGRAEKIFNKKDHRSIVIDEVCGMLLSLLFIPFDPRFAIIAFFVFRLLDTVKPYPANRLQELKGSAGVMSDDIVAGLYTNVILQVVVRVVSFRTS
jgi:phosphatidylglycerophosphatase A